MSTLGLVHTICGYSALIFGGAVLLLRKGTNLHRFIGYLYIISMVILNVTALGIYRVFRTFGPFHILALMSLASVVVGFVPAYRKKGDWLKAHYKWMCWSYIGLLAATFAEIGVHLLPNLPPLVRLFFAFISPPLVIFVGRYFLLRQQQQTLKNTVWVSRARA